MTETSTIPGSPVGWVRAVDARLLAPGSAHRLACVRTVLALTLALRLGIGDWAPLGGRPGVLFRPVGVTHLLGGVPPGGVVVVIQVVGVLAALLAAAAQLPTRRFGLAVARWPWATLPVAWLALLLLAGIHTSAGKIMHNDVLLLLATVPILFAPSSARVGVRHHSSAYGWAPRASLAVVAAVYATSGLQKLLNSGLDWVLSDNMSWVLHQGASSGLAPGLGHWVAALPLIPSLFAAGALILELLAPVLLALRRTRPFYLLAAVMMHGSIALFLGLDYTSWVLTVAAVALPWDSVPRLSDPPDDHRTASRTSSVEADSSATLDT